MPPRRSASASVDGGDDNARRRQPFNPLQSRRSPQISTPPLEVILTPRATPKPVKRRAKRQTKVKSEPPEIDISRVRPPSPSDDPLLLSGTKSPPLRARFTPAFSSSPSDATHIDPPVSFAARLSAAARTDVLPVFNELRTVEEWSDLDDDDGFNLTGEYTGKYKILRVPTKVDPPARVDPWGRPVSPFPYSEIMERSLPLSDYGGAEDMLNAAMSNDVDMWEAATEPPVSDVEASPSPSRASSDEFALLDDDLPLFGFDAESTQVRPFVDHHEGTPDSDPTTEEEQEEEAQIDRELSVFADDGPSVPVALAEPDEHIDAIEDENGSSDDEDVEGEDIIKITSEDPKAAARAAAILRMHDYDCILAAEKKKRSGRSTKSGRKRRKTIENAGISKSYTDLRSQRWQTGQVSPGSRSLPLLELWKDAEDSVFLEHHSTIHCDTSFTLSPLNATKTLTEPLLPPLSGKWTRDCWKCLDKCLVAERLAVGAARGLGTDVLADLGEVSKDAVLDRFISRLGGESILVGFGSEWSRDNLLMRLDVLVKKQSRRRATRTSALARQDTTESPYSGLLQRAMALADEAESPLDSTVVSGRRHTRQGSPLSSASCPEPAWLTRTLHDPIRTPSRTPDPLLPHPKDQVHLRHASLPPKSLIPVPSRPKRLVDLRHRSPIKADRGWRPASGRSSGGSVRDLVRQFESLDKSL